MAASTETVVLSEVADSKEFNGKCLPVVFSPGPACSSFVELATWLSANRSKVFDSAKEHGAVLFRGFKVSSPEDFAEIMDSSLALPVFPYVGGAAVRTKVVGDRVFTANEAPASEPIPFHHEVAQSPTPPDYIAFYCETAPESGGETPIISSTAVYDYFAGKYPTFATRMETLGVKYIRVMPAEDDATSAIGRSWRSTFNVSTKEQAEQQLRATGSSWEWLEGDNLRTVTGTVPGVRTDPRTGRKAFFNSVVAAYTGWTDSRNDPTKAVILGDGSAVDGAALQDVADWMAANRVAVPWQQGDVLFIDNHVAMHSRNPFTGPRRILASLAKRPTPSDVAASGAAAAASGASAVSDVSPTQPLSGTGDKMPLVGLGMWKVPKEKCAEITLESLKAGYTHIDSACDYGNEREVGAGLRAALEQGVIKREDLWVTSKLWNTSHAAEHVEEACRRTLSDLGVEYLDLYLIHFPIALEYVPFDTRYPAEWLKDPTEDSPKMHFAKAPLHETWAAMEALVAKGLVRNIGVCNMGTAQLADLMTYAKVPCSVLQVELHPYNTQDRLVRFAKNAGMLVTGFSPLGAGSYIELGMASAGDSALKEPIVQRIASKHGKTAAQVLLRWGLQRGCAVIPKTSKVERLPENFNIWDFKLSSEEVAAIAALNCNRRFNDPGVFCELAFGTFAPIYE